MSRRTGLNARFDGFNEVYFGARLPPYTVVAFTRLERFELQPEGYHDRKRREIMIRRGVSNPDETLIHEMAHAATNDHHGPRWRAEMTRLAGLCAPVAAADLVPPLLTRLRRADVEAAAADWLMAVPEGKFDAFVRAFVTDGRAPHCATADDAGRTYPWMRLAFERVRASR